MPERANVLIVGGGVIGSSLAWGLAERGIDDVVVLDVDLAGLYASSELNAGGARATWWQAVNIESCLRTLEFFGEQADALSFRQTGYLWLYSDPTLHERALAAMAQQNTYGLDVESLSIAEVVERFPLVDRNLDELVGATFSPKDGLLNPNAVRRLYRERAEAAGAVFRDRDYVSGVETTRGSAATGSARRVTALRVQELTPQDVFDGEHRLRDLLTSHAAPAANVARELRIECDTIVNCLGAWSPIFSAKIGIRQVSEPVRRQICLVDAHAEDLADGVKLASSGMIVDPSGLYIHGEGPHLLAGYSTPAEPPGFDFHYDGSDFFEQEIWPRLAHRSSSFERCGHMRGWAGLYAVTPDRSGIASAVAGWSNLFEAHSFTGRGVMQSYAVGLAMAALIDTGRFETVDLSPLSRERFSDPSRWVTEELHI